MKDGGSAFPSPGVVLTGTNGDLSRQQGAYGGMSLRDYFAIHAPEPSTERVTAQQTLDRGRNPHNDSYKPRLRTELEIKSDLRYSYADAMLKARIKETT